MAAERAGEVGLVGAALAVTAVTLPTQPLGALGRPATWQSDATADTVRDVLRRIPDGARVAAANGLAPQLTARAEVYLFPRYPGGPGVRPEWVAAYDRPQDGLFPARQEADAVRALAPARPGTPRSAAAAASPSTALVGRGCEGV
ncbi:hypothetical protein ACFXDE_04450 [Kitasatospora sp. NPDC059408]|uniref:hypothetical protein n=1 Tax=Kitasatospora sp. NPDC059408 TaxID=3346823 RepID=UPI00367B93A1